MTRPESFPSTQIPDNVELIQNTHGLFRLVYGIHLLNHRPAELGNSMGGVVVELSPEPRDEVAEAAISTSQYETALEMAAAKQKPVFTADIIFDRYLAGVFKIVSDILGVNTGIATSMIAADKSAGLTRRAFLQRGTSGAIAAYIGTDYLSRLIAGIGDPKQELTQQAAFLEGRVSLPGIYITRLRSLLLANNMESIARHYPAEFKTEELVGIFGTAHKEMGQALQMGHEERIEEIIGILKRLPAPLGLTATGLSKVLRLDYDNQRGARSVAGSFIDEDMKRAALEAGFPEN